MKLSDRMHGDPKYGKNLRAMRADKTVTFMPIDEYAAGEEMRIRLGLPIGCGLDYEAMRSLDAVTKKALADSDADAVK